MAPSANTNSGHKVGQWMTTVGLALAFGTLAGLGAWLFGANGHSHRVSSAAVQAPVQPEAAAPANPWPTAVSSNEMLWREQDLYLVDSDARADQLRAAIAIVSDPMQVPVTEIIVLPDDGPAATQQILLMLSLVNQDRWLQGVPPVQLIDLRRGGVPAHPGGAVRGDTLNASTRHATREEVEGPS